MKHVIYEITDGESSLKPQWYGSTEPLNAPEPEMLIDLDKLVHESHTDLHEDVFSFLHAHGLDSLRAQDMANRFIAALPLLHPATLGVVVRSLGGGHWQIVAERGQ